MNEVLAPVWDEQIVRLRVGIEPRDALGRPGPLPGFGVHLEDVPRPFAITGAARAAGALGVPDPSIGLPGIDRSPSGRVAVAFGSALVDRPGPIVVRVVDRSRRYVPRRLSIAAPEIDAVRLAELAHANDPTQPLAPRGCRPALYPGADYGIGVGVTAVRGRVVFGVAGGPPVPWARIEATTTGVAQPEPWWAHGDEHGEFLLIVGTLPRQAAVQKSRTVDLDLTVHARPFPAPGSPIDSPAESTDDPLWHLPIETVGVLDDPTDPVVRGTALPAGSVAGPTTTVTVPRGGVARPSPFILT